MRIAWSSCAAPVPSGEKLCTLDVPPTPAFDRQALELVFHGVEKTESSLIVRIALAAHSHPPVPIGELYTYGEGPRSGGEERGRFDPMTLTLDVTPSARLFAGAVDVQVRMFDHQGREATAEALSVASLELRTIEPV